MPPKPALLELATRRNSYVCRSCLSALGFSRPAQNQHCIRGYARGPHKQNGSRIKEKAESSKAPQEGPDKGFTVNYFEKDPLTGEVTRVEVDQDDQDGEDGEDFPDFEDMDEHLEEVDRVATAKAEKISAQLDKLNSMTGVLERIVEKHGPPGALEALNRLMATYDNKTATPEGAEEFDEAEENRRYGPGAAGEDLEDGVEVDNYEDTGIAPVVLTNSKHPGSPTTRKKAKMIADCNALNKSIKSSFDAIEAGKVTSQLIRTTWKTFEAVTPLILTAQVHVPPEAWAILWKIFSFDGPANPRKAAATWSLYKHMVQVGVPISNEQRLQAIEATFEAGQRAEAVDTWKRLVADLGEQDSPAAVDYWELGVSMYSQLGDTARAERASKALFERSTPDKPADSRVLFHLIQTYCAQPETAEKGFLLYRRMRELAMKLEKPMEIGDYDDVIALFLKSGHTDFAMFAFTDMMLDGTVNLYGQAKLPNQVRNSFFFGKWLKRLIGAGDLDGAYSVLVFMQKNGVVAASVQVNGLLGAWLRTGRVPDRRKADDFAWAMIRSRKAFVDLRRRQREAHGPARLIDNRPSSSSHEGSDLDHDMVPRATGETFIILAENYRSRGLFSRLEELFVAFKECEMPGDAMMMNELMAAAVAQNRGDKAREMYQLMVHEHGITPNIDTFAVLFSSLPINMLRGRAIRPNLAAEYHRDARDVFRELMESAWARDAASLDEAGAPGSDSGGSRAAMSAGQAKLILHSFRKSNDWAGLVAALEGLRDVVGFRMTRGVALELLAEVEALDRPTPRSARAVIRATVKLQFLVSKMQERGPIEGVEGTAEGIKDPRVLYQVLLDYYHTKFQTDEASSQTLVREVKKEMGVTGAAKRDARRRSREQQSMD